MTAAEPPAPEVPAGVAGPGGDRAGPRRRRRAVGPAGARPGRPLDALVADQGRLPPPDGGPPEDDARLIADVPPHHGGH